MNHSPRLILNRTSRYAACGAALGVASCGANDSERRMDGRTDTWTHRIALPELRPALLGRNKKKCQNRQMKLYLKKGRSLADDFCIGNKVMIKNHIGAGGINRG